LGVLSTKRFFEANANPDRLKWEVKSPLKEGMITWTGVANHVNDQLEQKVLVRQLPLKMSVRSANGGLAWQRWLASLYLV